MCNFICSMPPVNMCYLMCSMPPVNMCYFICPMPPVKMFYFICSMLPVNMSYFCILHAPLRTCALIVVCSSPLLCCMFCCVFHAPVNIFFNIVFQPYLCLFQLPVKIVFSLFVPPSANMCSYCLFRPIWSLRYIVTCTRIRALLFVPAPFCEHCVLLFVPSHLVNICSYRC